MAEKCIHCGADIVQDGQPDKAWLIKGNAGKYKLWCPLNKHGGEHEPENHKGGEEHE